MMVKGQPSSLSGMVQARASSLNGLMGMGDCTEDADGNIACDNVDDAPYSTPTTTTGGTTTTGSGGSSNPFGFLTSLVGDAATVANTALKSTTQTCQVINGQTVCTTSTTGGGVPTTSASALLGAGNSSLMLMLGLGVLALVLVAGKK